MISKYVILGRLTPYRAIKREVVDDQTTNDIINEILKTHIKYRNEYDKISSLFWRGNITASCRAIFDFLKTNVKYRIEPDTTQTVKSPAAIISTALTNGYNDCKHYSTFFAGIIDSWKRSGKPINWAYRFANYNYGKRLPHHVFVVVNPNTDREIWCDAVLPTFNEKKMYVNKIDKKV